MFRAFWVLATLVASVCALSSTWAAEPAFAVIAAPGIVDTHLTRQELAQIFLHKQNHWENGLRIQPVNLPASNPLRRMFSQTILGHFPEELEDYWREMYFHGVLPPHVLASEEAVILFVASSPGAIGYVATCYPDRRVTVVLVIGELPHCAK
jgi:ABC-type phosphate transport system substrate-binding protein